MARQTLSWREISCFGLIVWLCGCGPVTYAVDVHSAEDIVAKARAENADYYAPYELYFAEAQLAKAREEAAEGHYEDALEMVSVAEAYGRRALERSARPGEQDP
jgi:hypothetical protein